MAKTKKKADVVVLRRPIDTDALALFRWQCNPETRRYFRRPDPVLWEDHVRWFASRFTDESFLFLDVNGITIGCAWLDDFKSGLSSISVVIAPEHRGRGYGTKLIALATKRYERLVSGSQIYAVVHVDNKASYAAFLSAGYEIYLRRPPWAQLRWTGGPLLGGATTSESAG